MNIFHRYVIREHLAPFFFAFSLIMFVLILKQMLELMDMVISKNVNILIMLKLFWFNLAWMIALVVPMSVLVATVMAFGRMAADREITAMKAAGISMWNLSFPIIGLSIIITMFMIWFNNRILPDYNYRARNLNLAIAFKKPMFTLINREGQFITDLPNLTLHVDKIDYLSGEMTGITLFKRNDDGGQTTICAHTGRFFSQQEEGRLTLALKNGELHQMDDKNSERYVRGIFSRFNYNVNFDSNLSTSQMATKNDRTMTSDEMRYEIKKHEQIIAHFQERINSLPDDSPASKNKKNDFNAEIWRNKSKISKYLVEIHKKNSIPFAAIIFVLVGAPLGMLVRRSGASIGIGMSIGFFMIYYLFLIGGESAGDRMLIAPWLAMWAPNFVLGILGIGLFIHATRR
ncbi:LptF/LptG family permease [bacterium]|nr:LptF/LptG family permease [bacterium]